MHYLKSFMPLLNLLRSQGSVIALAAALFVVSGCSNEKEEQMQTQLDRLQKVIDSQIGAMNELGESHQRLQAQVNEYADIRFEVSDVQYELVEKAFEPLLMGAATLSIAGDQKPELIFVEWVLELMLENNKPMMVTYIQRVENGVATLNFTQSLPRHNIKENSLAIKVKPTAWYMGHVAHLR